MIGSIAIALVLSFIQPQEAQEPWDYLGECRITTYCQYCNEPAGYGSSSGKELAYGDAACGWLPEGSQISIEGEVFTIVDKCGTDAIDLFIPSDCGYCDCDLNIKTHVSVRYPND